MGQARVTPRGLAIVLMISSLSTSGSLARAEESPAQSGRMVLPGGFGCREELAYLNGQEIKVNLFPIEQRPVRYRLTGVDEMRGGADFDVLFLDAARKQIAFHDSAGAVQEGDVPAAATRGIVCLFDTDSSQRLEGKTSPMPARFTYQEVRG